MNTKEIAIVQVLYSFAHGGSEKVGLQLAAKMQQLGHQVHVISVFDDDGPIADDLRKLDIPCAGFGRFLFRGRGNWLFSKAICRYLERLAPLALHVHHGLTLGRVLPAAKRLEVSRIVLTEHSIRALQEMTRYRRQVASWLREADFVTTLSDEMTNYMASHLSVDIDKLSVIPNGIDLSGVDEGHKDTMVGSDEQQRRFRFVWVGRFDADKDLETLISAFCLAHTRAPAIELHLIGDGQCRTSIERLVQSKQLEESVLFHGFESRVTRILGSYDAFVMSSRSEGMPMALLEAMASGLPCIATRVGAIPEMLADGAGLLADAGNKEMLCERLIALYENLDLRVRLAAVARERVEERYSLDKVTQRYLSLLVS